MQVFCWHPVDLSPCRSGFDTAELARTPGTAAAFLSNNSAVVVDALPPSGGSAGVWIVICVVTRKSAHMEQ